MTVNAGQYIIDDSVDIVIKCSRVWPKQLYHNQKLGSQDIIST